MEWPRKARPPPTGKPMCESYFGVARLDGGGVLSPRARERWPAIASGSWREQSHQITPKVPVGSGPSSVPRYERRRQEARRDIAIQSLSFAGPMMHVTFEPWRRLRTAVDWCRAPATTWSVSPDDKERSVKKSFFFSFSFSFFFHTHTHTARGSERHRSSGLG